MGRKKKEDHEEGAPAWIVTFSDLMSLLLTFFVLLLSFSTISEQEFNQAMMSLDGAFGLLPRFSGVVSIAPRRPRRPTEDTADAARKLRRQLQIEGLEKQVRIEYDAMGGIKISLPNAVLFGAGDAELRAESAPVLEDIARVLSEMPDTFVEVHGHTDDSPVGAPSRFRDNYDLSYYRADAVARQLVSFGGVPPRQFEVVACGPSQPASTNTTEEGRRSNRRVEIFVRGLVDKNKIDALLGEPEQDEFALPPVELPFSPREFDALR